MAFQLPCEVPPILHLVNHGSRCSQGQEKQSFPWWEREFVWNGGLPSDDRNTRKVQIREYGWVELVRVVEQFELTSY